MGEGRTRILSTRRSFRSGKGALAALAAAVAVTAATLVGMASPALADTNDTTELKTVPTVDPAGTTVNLFDYWVDGTSETTKLTHINEGRHNFNQSGINAGHALKFSDGGLGGINAYTGRGNPPYLGIVQGTLQNGYPELASNNESLRYLFDPDMTNDGKASYAGVSGLFQLVDGYYTFNSSKNYAVYAPYDHEAGQAADTSNSFNVYNKPAVWKGRDGGDTRPLGQFFPFDRSSKVFTNGNANGVWDGENQEGTDTNSNIMLNHHFGLSMHTRFTVPEDSQTGLDGEGSPVSRATNGKPTVFNFSGDDDVWIYIDGMLVGDLGGIHGAESISINFSTGDVSVYRPNKDKDTADPRGDKVDGQNGPSGTIESLMKKANPGVSGDYFTTDGALKGGTTHTLDFFYLERGAGASDMSLQFNLTLQPVSRVEKVDQDASGVAGAQFELYRANDGYQPDGAALATGTTDASGQLHLLQNGQPVTFNTIQGQSDGKFVLRETSTPDGYRSNLAQALDEAQGELHLEYVTSSNPSAMNVRGGMVRSPQQEVTLDNGDKKTFSRQWLNGGYLGTSELLFIPISNGVSGAEDTANALVADGTITTSNETKIEKGSTINLLDGGMTWAVPMKKSSDGTNTTWTPIKGTALGGYSLAKASGIAGAVEALHAGSASMFSRSVENNYQTELENLPGYVDQYECMVSDTSTAQYTVGIFHSTASDASGVTADNTVEIDRYHSPVSGGSDSSTTDVDSTPRAFTRQFAARLYITNTQNRLFVAKMDDAGNPVNGATFSLYKEEQVENGHVKDNETPIDTMTTGDRTYPFQEAGVGCFPIDSDGHTPLTNGIYYLAETGVPDGYEVNPTLTKVIVDDTGVYVDAGIEGDGVLSASGTGSVLATLRQFADPDGLDHTLTKVTGTLQQATLGSNGALTWNNPAEGAQRLNFVYPAATPDGTTPQYQLADNSDGTPYITSDTGINRLQLTQTEKPAEGQGDDLTGLPLNQLFSTSTGVIYKDQRVARLQVTKTVKTAQGVTAPKTADGGDQQFTFKFDTLGDGTSSYDATVTNADNDHTVDTSHGTEGKFQIKRGDTVTIKAGQTINVYGLKEGDSYSVSEDTTDLPEGWALVSRKAGGKELSGDPGPIAGTIAATRDSKTPDANKLEFVDQYDPTIDYSLGFTKKLDGHAMSEGQFEFTLKPVDPASANRLDIPMDGKVFKSPAAAAGETSAVVDLLGGRKVTFDSADAGKTYRYSLQETKGGDAGYTNDFATRDITIKVAASGSQLTATTTISVRGSGKAPQVTTYTSGAANNQKAVASFENSYKAEGSVTLQGIKTLTGNHPMSDDDFSFTVHEGLDSTGTPVAAGKNKAASPDSAGKAAGKIDFTPISYTQADVGTHYYVVSEDADSKGLGNGTTGVRTAQVVRVDVTDKGDGKLATAVSYPKLDADGATSDGAEVTNGVNLANEYHVDPIHVEINGGKDYEVPDGDGYNAPDIDGKYEFTLTGLNNAPMPSGSDPQTNSKAVTNSAGNVDFGSIAYKAADVFKESSAQNDASSGGADTGTTSTSETQSKTFTYTVTEKRAADAPAGVTADTSTKTIHVTVTDDSQGKLTARVTDADGNELDGLKFVFTNRYEPKPATTSVSDSVDITKTLSGRALKDGEFQFQLVDARTGEVVQTASNDGSGHVAFDKITYDHPGDWYYRVREVAGTSGGVTYDGRSATIHVHVEDNGEGQLEATSTKVARLGNDVMPTDADEKSLAFENSYKVVNGTTALIPGTKVLEGGTLQSGQFTFELRDKDTGEVVATATNAADGRFTLAVSYDADVLGDATSKDFHYQVVEKDDGQDGVTYDHSAHDVDVTVFDDGAGGLAAQVSGTDGLSFTNTQAGGGNPGGGSDGPGSPLQAVASALRLPQTGDPFSLGVLVGIAGVAVAAIATGLHMRRQH